MKRITSLQERAWLAPMRSCLREIQILIEMDALAEDRKSA